MRRTIAMKSILQAWALALGLALAVMLGFPSAAVAGQHSGKGCYAHRALTICKHNETWSKATLKRTYKAAYKKKRVSHRHHGHRKAHWRKHHRHHHHAHHRHGRHHAHHGYRHHRKHHARHHRKHHAAHVDLVIRQQSIVTGPCETELPRLYHEDKCVHGAIIYPPVVERAKDPVLNSERGRTRRYYPRGYYDPNAWRYRPTDQQIIRAFHKKHGMKH
jgi:hypothetical protein